jgi:hypothetical protein
VAINSVIFNLARFVGPACAGPAIVWSGESGAFAANAASYLVFLVAPPAFASLSRMTPRSSAAA